MSGAAQGERAKAVDEAAAGWYARMRLGAPTARDQRAFEGWIACDAANARAYATYEKLWSALGPMGNDPRVASVHRDSVATADARRLSRAHWRGASLAAAAALALAAVGLGWFMLNGEPEAFATAIGQHSTVPLEDGSTVVLNTDSAIQPSYSARERAVRLVRGQALFEVAKNPARPFVVYAGNRRIVALGTSFDVRIEDSGVRVTLVDGRVAVDTVSAPSSSQPIELTPGQQLIGAPDAPDEVRQADVASITSWREGRLIFSGEALGTAVAEINRYSNIKVVLANPDLEELRVSGVFRTGHTAGFIAALEARFPVEVASRDAERIVLR